MIDRKEKQSSIIPVKKHVLVKFVALEEKKTAAGVIVPKGSMDHIVFKEDKIYLVEILRKANDCKDWIPSNGFAIVNQLAGYGIPTVEDGYVKIVPESLILMTSKTKEMKLTEITPMYKRALVKINSKVEKTESGLYVPSNAKMNTNWDAATLGGEVVGVSPDIEDLKIGEHIRFDAYMGTEIHIEGEEYRLVLEDEIIAKISQDEQQ